MRRRANGSPGPSERELWAGLEEDGFVCLPAGSSGSGTGSDRPDGAVGGGPGALPVMFVEAKTTTKEARTIKQREYEQLGRAASAFGAEPVIAVYWKGPPGGSEYHGGWFFRHADAVRRSPAENDRGGHHLRPVRSSKESWSDWSDLLGGRLSGFSDPHAGDECVVCGRGPEPGGPAMRPLVGAPGDCVCGGCSGR